jgi:hypothetical protein
MGEKRNVYRLLVGKPEGKRPLGKPKRRWIHNIKMDCGGTEYMGHSEGKLSSGSETVSCVHHFEPNKRVLPGMGS